MNPLVAGYAERHQIPLIVRATVRNRLDVMHECCEDVSPLLLAALTERMPCQMSVTNPTPQAAIPLGLIVPARKVLVVSLHNFLVLLAITAFSIRKVRAACHAAGALRLSRHRTPQSPRGELDCTPKSGQGNKSLSYAFTSNFSGALHCACSVFRILMLYK